MAGAAGKTAERARYIQLTKQGLNNAEICRQLGIGRKTGSNWRNGHYARDPSGARRNYPPIVEVRASVISARFLSEDERVQIADLRKTGAGVQQIATLLGRSALIRILRNVSRSSHQPSIESPVRWLGQPIQGRWSAASMGQRSGLIAQWSEVDNSHPGEYHWRQQWSPSATVQYPPRSAAIARRHGGRRPPLQGKAHPPTFRRRCAASSPTQGHAP